MAGYRRLKAATFSNVDYCLSCEVSQHHFRKTPVVPLLIYQINKSLHKLSAKVWGGWRASTWVASGHSFCQKWAASPPPWPRSWLHPHHIASSSRPHASHLAAQRAGPRWLAVKGHAGPDRLGRSCPVARHLVVAASLWKQQDEYGETVFTAGVMFQICLRLVKDILFPTHFPSIIFSKVIFLSNKLICIKIKKIWFHVHKYIHSSSEWLNLTGVACTSPSQYALYIFDHTFFNACIKRSTILSQQEKGLKETTK